MMYQDPDHSAECVYGFCLMIVSSSKGSCPPRQETWKIGLATTQALVKAGVPHLRLQKPSRLSAAGSFQQQLACHRPHTPSLLKASAAVTLSLNPVSDIAEEFKGDGAQGIEMRWLLFQTDSHFCKAADKGQRVGHLLWIDAHWRGKNG
mmetsp:Transcript_18751/g.45132  ORF Transcript_18751/g.45132 Transcript_18751/m.45132 type:complete len:149 (+) Transcript_18751:4492-4938(+)